MIEKISELAHINNIESDPTLHGSGLHVHPRFGRLRKSESS